MNNQSKRSGAKVGRSVKNTPSKPTRKYWRHGRKTGTTTAPVAVQTRTRGAAPRFKPTSRSSIIVTHKELFAQVNLAQGESFPDKFYFVYDYVINPSSTNLSPWLANIATNYEKYRYHSLTFEYKPTCPTTLGGWITLSVDFDVDDDHLSSSLLEEKVMAMNRSDSVESTLWSPVSLHLSKQTLNRIGERWVYGGTEETVDENRTVYAGKLYIAAAGPSEIDWVGEIYVSYSVELMFPQGVTRASSIASAVLSCDISSSADLDPDAPPLQSMPAQPFKVVVTGPTTPIQFALNVDTTNDTPITVVALGEPQQVPDSQIWEQDTALEALETGLFEILGERTVRPGNDAGVLNFAELNKPTLGSWTMEEREASGGDWKTVGRVEHETRPFSKGSGPQTDTTGEATETFSWVGQLTKGKLYRYLSKNAIPLIAQGIGRYMQLYARSSNGIKGMGKLRPELIRKTLTHAYETPAPTGREYLLALGLLREEQRDTGPFRAGASAVDKPAELERTRSLRTLTCRLGTPR